MDLTTITPSLRTATAPKSRFDAAVDVPIDPTEWQCVRFIEPGIYRCGDSSPVADRADREKPATEPGTCYVYPGTIRIFRRIKPGYCRQDVLIEIQSGLPIALLFATHAPWYGLKMLLEHPDHHAVYQVLYLMLCVFGSAYCEGKSDTESKWQSAYLDKRIKKVRGKKRAEILPKGTGIE